MTRHAWTWWLPTRAEWRIAWIDLLAVLAGDCNDKATTGDLDRDTGGWAYWRCALRRGHTGAHRFRHSVWTRTGTFHYPLPSGRGQRPKAGPSPRRKVLDAAWSQRVRRELWHRRAAARLERERLQRGGTP